MRLILVQQDIVWGDPSANRRRLESLISGGGECDLIVLPEMFSTGFVTDPRGLAEEVPAASLDWMISVARRKNCALAGSLAVCEEGKYFNRFYFVGPEGVIASYDKKHLFTYGGEDRSFSPGDRRVIVEWRGVRFLLAVCYDLRFPVWLRNRGDYDALLVVASWPEVRRQAWDTLVRARAIENQCFVAAVDRTGEDPSNTYSGGTAFVDPYGKVVSSCPDWKEGIIESELDMGLLEEFRRKFPVLDDSDSFELL